MRLFSVGVEPCVVVPEDPSGRRELLPGRMGSGIAGTVLMRFASYPGEAVAQALLVFTGCILAAWSVTVALPVIVFWIAPVVVAIELGKSRGRTGWTWGVFLSWVGVLILAVMRSREPLKGGPPSP